MQTITLSRWGNSLGLRLPKGVIDGQGLHAGDKVTIELVGDVITMKKAVEPKTYNLADIIDCFRPAAETAELDWGEEEGMEFDANNS